MLRTSDSGSAVEERLATLERAHRRLKSAAILGAIFAAFTLVAPYNSDLRHLVPARERVEAREFVVVDAHGRPRGALSVTADGTPSLTLSDGRAKRRVSLTVGADSEGRLDLADKDEHSRASLSVTPDGAPFLAFIDQHDALRTGLMLNDAGAAALILMDHTGHGRIGLGVRPDDSPRICLVEKRDWRCRGVHPSTTTAVKQPAIEAPGGARVSSAATSELVAAIFSED